MSLKEPQKYRLSPFQQFLEYAGADAKINKHAWGPVAFCEFPNPSRHNLKRWCCKAVAKTAQPEIGHNLIQAWWAWKPQSATKKLHDESRQLIVFSCCRFPVCSSRQSTLKRSKEHLHPSAEEGGKHIVVRYIHSLLHPCSPWSIKALTFDFALCCFRLTRKLCGEKTLQRFLAATSAYLIDSTSTRSWWAWLSPLDVWWTLMNIQPNLKAPSAL